MSEIKAPLVYKVFTWAWNIMSIIALISCIYIYKEYSSVQSELKEDKRTLLKYKDSIDLRLKYLDDVMDDTYVVVEEHTEGVDEVYKDLQLKYNILLTNLDSIKAFQRKRDSIKFSGKKELTDEERQNYLYNKFYSRDTTINQ